MYKKTISKIKYEIHIKQELMRQQHNDNYISFKHIDIYKKIIIDILAQI